MPARLAYRGICVSDLGASQAFYVDGLGYAARSHPTRLSGAWLNRATGLSGVRLRVALLDHPRGPTVALLHFETPPAVGARERRPTNQLGLNHFSWVVRDLDAALARIEAAGGTVVAQTRTVVPPGDTTLVYATDPDGTRMAMTSRPEAPEGLAFASICVADSALSSRYYQRLGFEPAGTYAMPEPADWRSTINEIPGITQHVELLREEGGHVLELMQVLAPGPVGHGEPTAVNHFGFTDIGFWTDDIDAQAESLAAVGGRWAFDARVRYGGIELLPGYDPDGVRITLICESRD